MFQDIYFRRKKKHKEVENTQIKYTNHLIKSVKVTEHFKHPKYLYIGVMLETQTNIEEQHTDASLNLEV